MNPVERVILFILTVTLSGCSKYDPGTQPNSPEALLNIASSSPSCYLSEAVTIYSAKDVKGNSEYILVIDGDLGPIPIRLYKESLTLGGYLLSGVSHDGNYRAEASVNHLSKDGTDFKLDKLEHYRQGVKSESIYKHCNSI